MVRRMSTTTERSFLDGVISHEGLVEPDQLAGVLRVTKGELATASGLSRDAVSKTLRLPGTGLSRSRHLAIRPLRTWFVPGGRNI